MSTSATNGVPQQFKNIAASLSKLMIDDARYLLRATSKTDMTVNTYNDRKLVRVRESNSDCGGNHYECMEIKENQQRMPN